MKILLRLLRLQAEAEELNQSKSMGTSIETGLSFHSSLIWFSTSYIIEELRTVHKGYVVRVVFVHLIFIPNWKLKSKIPNRDFYLFDSSRIENHKFTILIVNFCFYER